MASQINNFLILSNAMTLYKMDVNNLANCSIYPGLRSITLQTPQRKWFILTDPIESRSIRTNEYNTTIINGQLRKTHLIHLQRLRSLHSLENNIKSTISVYIYIYIYLSPPSRVSCSESFYLYMHICIYTCIFIYKPISNKSLSRPLGLSLKNTH